MLHYLFCYNNHPPAFLPLSCATLTPPASGPSYRDNNPDPSPHHCPQPESRQHQKHRPHHQINNHVILRILGLGQIPAAVGITVVEHIQQPDISPPRQFSPKGEEVLPFVDAGSGALLGVV